MVLWMISFALFVDILWLRITEGIQSDLRAKIICTDTNRIGRLKTREIPGMKEKGNAEGSEKKNKYQPKSTLPQTCQNLAEKEFVFVMVFYYLHQDIRRTLRFFHILPCVL